MELNEATSLTKALVLHSAGLAGLEVTPDAPELFVELVRAGFSRPGVLKGRRPEAVANLLRLVAATLEVAQERQAPVITVDTADAARERVCPVYPFD